MQLQLRYYSQSQKYNQPKLDDASVDGLIKHFQFESNAELAQFLELGRSDE
jgi:hypothetical protein